MRATNKAEKEESLKLFEIIQKLSEKEQLGVLMMVQGLQALSESKAVKCRSVPLAQTFEETP